MYLCVFVCVSYEAGEWPRVCEDENMYSSGVQDGVVKMYLAGCVSAYIYMSVCGNDCE